MNKKILFILPVKGFGGAELHTIDLAKFFSEKGSDVDFCFPTTVENIKLINACGICDFGVISASISPVQEIHQVGAYKQQHESLVSAVDLKIYDFVFIASPSPRTGMGCLAALSESGVPGAIIYHLVSEDLNLSRSERAYFDQAISANIAMLCVSDFTKDKLVEASGIDSEKFKVIENGIELQSAPIIAKNFDLRAKIGRPGKKIILTSGRLHPQKGISVLLNVIKLTIESRDDVHFVIVGEGPSRTEIDEFILQHRLGTDVSLLGFVPEPYRLFSQADVIALPTLYEGLSLTLLESLHSGACILTTDASYQDKILTSEYDALVVPRSNVELFAQALNRLLDDAELRESLKLGASKTARSFTKERMLNAYTNLIDDSFEISEGNSSPILPQIALSVYDGEYGIQINDKSGNDFIALLSLLTSQKDVSLEFDDITFYPHGFAGRGIRISLQSFPCRNDFSLLLLMLVEHVQAQGGVISVFWRALQSVLLMDRQGNIKHSTYMWGRLLAYLSKLPGDENPALYALLQRKNQVNTRYQSDIINTAKSVLSETKLSQWLGKDSSLTTRNNSVKPNQNTVLIFIPSLALPEHNGSSARVAQVINAYRSAGLDVHIATFGVNQDKDFVTEQHLLQRYNATMHLLHRSKSTCEKHSKSYSAISKGQFDKVDFYTPDVASQFYELVLEVSPTTLHINYCYFSWLLAFNPNLKAKTVLDTHDLISRRSVISKMVEQQCGGSITNVYDADLSMFSKQFINKSIYTNFDVSPIEFNAFNAFDIVLMISKEEKAIVKKLDVKAELVWLPYLPEVKLTSPKLANGSVNAAYIGGMNALNIIGAAGLVRRIVPRLIGLGHDFTCLFGGAVSKAFNHLEGNYKFGFVEDLGDLLTLADFSVCSQPVGTGQSIKIADSIAAGLPVVAFSGVAEASLIVHGVNGLIAHDLEEFYQHCRLLVVDKEYLSNLQKTTQSWAKENLGQARFESIFNAEVCNG